MLYTSTRSFTDGLFFRSQILVLQMQRITQTNIDSAPMPIKIHDQVGTEIRKKNTAQYK